MSVEQAIYTLLTSTHAGTAALISTRCYPLLLPQNATLPAVVYQRVSSSGRMGTTDRRTSRLQFSCWGVTYAGAKALAVQVRDAIEGFANITIRMGLVVNEIDDYGEIPELQRVLIDAIFTIVE